MDTARMVRIWGIRSKGTLNKLWCHHPRGICRDYSLNRAAQIKVQNHQLELSPSL
jgi:hypothetical protein